MTEKTLWTDDFVQPFQLESSSLRGRLVRLGPALDIILHQHAYPEPVGALLGEATVIAAALGTALKYEGVFTLQIKSDGPVCMLVADVTNDGGIRAYAQIAEGGLPVDNLGLLGKGYLAFTVDQKMKDDRYQGIVEMNGENIAEAVQHYFRQSEQLPTGIVAAVHCDGQGRWHGGCLMLQKMPREGGVGYESDTSVEDDWLRAMMLMGTCTPAELTDPGLSANDLLFRLFHEEGVRVFDPHPFRHQCRCSEARVTDMLRSLPREEIEELAINGIVDVTCEFCNKSYKFDKARREEIFRAG
jgi:molecular chaperone Hsp33